MPRRRPRASPHRSGPATISPLTLAVFHRSDDVERHVAALRRSRRVRVRLERQSVGRSCRATRSACCGNSRRTTTSLDGASCRSPDKRRPRPSASTNDRQLADLSRALGFQHHLASPLRLAEVERALGLPGVVDLADRLDDRHAPPRQARRRPRSSATCCARSTPPPIRRPSPRHSWRACRVAAAHRLVGHRGRAGRQRALAGGQEVDAAFKAPAEAIADAVVQSEQPLRDRAGRGRRPGWRAGRGRRARLAAGRERRDRRRARRLRPRPGAPGAAAHARRFVTRWRGWSSRPPTPWRTPCAWPGPRRCRSPTT